ncbi:hypothetical protein AAW14_16115 [Streptomyces hygroscopicus]|uniref:hypothetical protein n=1 Tax=Streptomyces hygroscopicus TaxID=1912 RepID=UPI0022403337|nr:hypothetical protein [Streptomyces hygroscopicus]MCW7943526.1 hypothetical protein [Streptomyces hygroscopicus]
MRRTSRLLTGTALAVVAGTTVATPAFGGDTRSLEVFPSTAVPGAEVTVNTAACGADGSAAGDATAVGGGTFMLAPSAHEQDAIGRFRVPPSAQPGTYEIVAKCSAGRHATVTGDLVVALTAAAAKDPTRPRGSVKTGVGGALGPDPVKTAAGVTALAIAAAGGTWLLHRRARGDGI